MKFKKYETNYKYKKLLKEKEYKGFKERFEKKKKKVIIKY